MAAGDVFFLVLVIAVAALGVARMIIIERDIRKGEERYQTLRLKILERQAGRAEWEMLGPGRYRCTHCGFELMSDAELIKEDRFCSRCGFKMWEENE